MKPVVLVPNWLGDGIMAMPALQALCRRDGVAGLTVLAKPGVLALWRMHPDVGTCWELGPGARGTVTAARRLRGERTRTVYVLPNSFRAALIPWLAGVPERVGVRGHRPAALMRPCLCLPRAYRDRHQSEEYRFLLGVDDGAAAEELPRLRVPPDVVGRIRERTRFGDGDRVVGVLPGAARGTAKRWPVERFAAVAGDLARRIPARILALGSAAEVDSCEAVVSAAGPAAINLAGRTNLAELAAALARCDVVICNDSGGMHLAAAMGVPVVAVFGITDPQKTGPLGLGHRIVGAEGVRQARDIPRRSAEAQRVLATIRVERVIEAAASVLAERPAS